MRASSKRSKGCASCGGYVNGVWCWATSWLANLSRGRAVCCTACKAHWFSQVPTADESRATKGH